MSLKPLMLILSTVLIGAVMGGCSSDPVNSTQYYLLSNQQTNQSSTEPLKQKITVLKVLELPQYLNQSQLVLQMNDHQLHYADFHMWAEPLKEGFTKALMMDLNRINSPVQFVSERLKRPTDKNTLYVELAFFHADNDSQVTLSGQYWFKDENNETMLQPYHFSFKQQLSQDGYASSVAQMRQLVGLLAAEVVKVL
jgi:uncharacterized lipoprotein YmbA